MILVLIILVLISVVNSLLSPQLPSFMSSNDFFDPCDKIWYLCIDSIFALLSTSFTEACDAIDEPTILVVEEEVVHQNHQHKNLLFLSCTQHIPCCY